MNKLVKLSVSIVALSGVIVVAGCSSSDNADGVNGKAVVPANAVLLTASNAESTVSTSVTTTGVLASAVVGVETTPTMGLRDALAFLQPRIDRAKESLKSSGADLVYGADLSESGSCFVSGSYSGSGHSDATSDSGNFTVTNCDDGEGVVINGSFAWSSTFNNTGEYNDTASGSFSIVSTGSPAFRFNFTGVDFAEVGNEFAGTYTVTKATSAVDFTGGGGFLITLAAPIVESVGGYVGSLGHCPESGAIFITGAEGSTAEGIYNGDDTMTIKVNGTVIDSAAYCYR